MHKILVAYEALNWQTLSATCIDIGGHKAVTISSLERLC